MLTDAALKSLKPKEKIYKVTDRDGMYVLVKPSGTLTFRLDYRMNGRRETVTLQVRPGRAVTRSCARAVHRREAGDQRGTIAGDREAA
jgi:Arm DNA-binding domain